MTKVNNHVHTNIKLISFYSLLQFFHNTLLIPRLYQLPWIFNWFKNCMLAHKILLMSDWISNKIRYYEGKKLTSVKTKGKHKTSCCVRSQIPLKSSIPLDILLHFVSFLHEPSSEAGLLQSDVLKAHIPVFRYKAFRSDRNRMSTYETIS